MNIQSIRFILLATLSLCSALEVLGSPQPLKVYFDSSRRMGGLFVWQSPALRGDMRATRVSDVARFELLERYDLMVILNATEECPYLTEELASIERFVKQGGGLLLIADPRKGRIQKSLKGHEQAVLPDADFSANQVARLFGVVFLAQWQKDTTPQFATVHPVNQGLDPAPQRFKQIVGAVAVTRGDAQAAVESSQGPAALAGAYGKGRFLIAALPDLLKDYRDKNDKVLTQANLVRQTALFRSWAGWLAAGSPQRNTEWKDCPPMVLPRDHLTNDCLDVHYIPQLRRDADKIMGQWDAFWENLGPFLGIRHPLEICGQSDARERLEVILQPTKGAGLAGQRVWISAWCDDPAGVAGLLGHEMAHKIVGGCNGATGEGFANWIGIRAMEAAGYSGSARKFRDRFIGSFRKADPKGNVLDIGLPTAKGPAAMGKWFWILDELTRRHGDGLMKSYLAALRTRVNLCAPNKKLVAGKKVPLSMEDHVAALSTAAGTDLHPWFRSLGITVDPTSTESKDDSSETEPEDVMQPDQAPNQPSTVDGGMTSLLPAGRVRSAATDLCHLATFYLEEHS
jgi:hypothetical protein